MKKITGDTLLREVLKKESFKKILEKHHFPCLTCPFAKMEMENLRIKDVSKMYGIDEKNLLKDLNEALMNEKDS
jgi:hypothetical protein